MNSTMVSLSIMSSSINRTEETIWLTFLLAQNERTDNE
jgi:hypothetical protein